MRIKRRVILPLIVAFFAWSLLFGGTTPWAASYPVRPIELIIGFNPGSVSDVIARSLANVARKYIDQPIVVINKAGGGGVVGNEYVITAKPDGYTVLLNYGGEAVLAPHMQKLPHNPVEATRPVIQISEAPIVLAVNGDSPFKRLKDIVEFAKQNPGKASFAGSTGGASQIVPEVFAFKAGVKFIFIPTAGTGATLTNLMGGHVTMGSLTPSVAVGPHRSKKVRALAVSSEKRNNVLPEVPTFREEGFDIVMGATKGIGVPKATPDEIVIYLHDAFKKCMEDPEFLAFMEKVGEPVIYRDSKEFTAYLRMLYKSSGEVIEALGMKAK